MSESPSFRAGRDVDGRVGLAAQPAHVFERLVQVALVQFSAGPRGQGRAPPADGALALDGRYAARQVAQRQGAGRQGLLGHDDARGDLPAVDQQADQIFLQGAQALAAHALAKDLAGGLCQNSGRLGRFPDQFADQETRCLGGKAQPAGLLRRSG